jgi:hypothetical protein
VVCDDPKPDEPPQYIPVNDSKPDESTNVRAKPPRLQPKRRVQRRR